MGIASLLPQLRSITKRKHLEAYRGKVVAVDGYVLLHRGVYSCARELVEGIPTDKYVSYCIGRVDLLLRHGITPYIVFDGGPLPNKEEEENSRARSRKEHKDRAQNLWRQGNRVAALDSYQKAVDVTPEMAHSVICMLKHRGIRFLVAPYEADAQLAYLALNGFADAVLTEDSDLLAYGCPLVLFKLDNNGEVDEISLADLPQCRELSFTGWTHDLFQQMCVMSGCDFLKGLPGIGIKKAHSHIRRTRDFSRALRALRFDGVQPPPGYEIKFQRALWTFRHQKVYCPRRREVVPLTEPPGGSLAAHAAFPTAAILEPGETDFLGPDLPVHVAQGIAEGRIHPITHLPMGGQREEPVSNRSKFVADIGAEMPVPISSEARQGFKKPRMATEPSNRTLSKRQKVVSSRPLPAAFTAKRYFSATAIHDKYTDTKDVRTLKTTLEAALRTCSGELHSNQDLALQKSDGFLDEHIRETHGNGDAFAVAPLWRPSSKFKTPLPRKQTTGIENQYLFEMHGDGGGNDDDVKETPGFYSGCKTLAPAPSRRATDAERSSRDVGRRSATTPEIVYSPTKLTFSSRPTHFTTSNNDEDKGANDVRDIETKEKMIEEKSPKSPKLFFAKFSCKK